MLPLSIFKDCLFSVILCYGTAANERKLGNFMDPLDICNEPIKLYFFGKMYNELSQQLALCLLT